MTISPSFPLSVDRWPVTLLRDAITLGHTDASAVAPQAAEATITTREEALAAVAVALVAVYGADAMKVLRLAGMVPKEMQ